MENLSLNQWLPSIEQKVIVVAEQIEALREKLLQVINPERDDTQTLSKLTNGLHKQAMRLRELGQVINLRAALMSRQKGSGQDGG